MADIKDIYIGSDTIVRLSALKDEDGVAVNDATVEMDLCPKAVHQPDKNSVLVDMGGGDVGIPCEDHSLLTDEVIKVTGIKNVTGKQTIKGTEVNLASGSVLNLGGSTNQVAIPATGHSIPIGTRVRVVGLGDYNGYYNTKDDMQDSIETINASPTAGGTGYAVGDILTVSEGLYGTVRVTAVSGGVVDTVELVTGGEQYTTGTGKATTGGSGNEDCTINITVVTNEANWVKIESPYIEKATTTDQLIYHPADKIVFAETYSAEHLSGDEPIYTIYTNGNGISLSQMSAPSGYEDGYYEGILPKTIYDLTPNGQLWLFITCSGSIDKVFRQPCEAVY